MDRKAFAGLMGIETMLAFGNTFAATFNIIYLFNVLDMPLWGGPTYLLMGFTISVFVSIWMSLRPHLDPRNVMLASLAFLCAEYVFLLVVDDGWLLSVMVGVAFGLFYPMFWTPFNVLMAQMTQKADRGVTYGAFFFVWPAVTFVAPLLGGLVIGLFSYQLLFALGFGIIAATALLVIAYRNYMPKDQVMRIHLDAIGRRNVVAVLGEGGFEGVFWVDITLIAWTFSTDEVSIGALFALFGLSAGLMAIILGKVSDRIQNRSFFLRASAVASIPCVVLVYFSSSMEEYALANGLLEFACFVIPVFLFAILTDKLEERKNDSVLTREYLLGIGRSSSVALLMLLLYLGLTPQDCFLLCIPFLALCLVAFEPRKGPSAAPIMTRQPD
jgi:MFS family permease